MLKSPPNNSDFLVGISFITRSQDVRQMRHQLQLVTGLQDRPQQRMPCRSSTTCGRTVEISLQPAIGAELHLALGMVRNSQIERASAITALQSESAFSASSGLL